MKHRLRLHLFALILGLFCTAGGAHAAIWGPGRVATWGCSGVTTQVCETTDPYVRVVDIAAGTGHNLALTVGGPVIYNWGCTLGVGECTPPTLFSGGLLAVAAGDAHSLALKPDGTVVAWGCGAPYDFGQCDVPSGMSGVTAIAAGTSQSLALRSDGTVTAWGCRDDDLGQCAVPPGLSDATAVAAGDAHSLALRKDGTVVAWGCEAPYDYGQCNVPSGLTGVTAVSAGTSQSLALKGDGTVVAWGCSGDDYGQCNAPSGLSGVIEVSAGDVHSLALRKDGTVVAWGCGAPYDYGQCAVPAGLPSVAGISAGVFHSLVRFKRDQTVSVSASVVSGTVRLPGRLDFVVMGQATSGLPVTFDASGICLLTGTPASGFANVHITGAGSCTVTVSQPGDRNFSAASGSTTVAVVKSDQTITFDSLPKATFRDLGLSLTASASSRLPVSFESAGQCVVESGTLRLTGAGTCTVTASQAGDANYNAAPKVSQVVEIAKANQTIVLDMPRRTPFSHRGITITARAPLPVSLAARGRCTLRGVTLRITGTGTCTVTATQSGDANYNAAAPVSQTMTIVKAAQTIKFALRAMRTLGSHAFRLHASTSSGLPLSFTAHGKCTVRGRLVHLLRAGFCTITAAQRGNANYKPARVSRTFAITRRR